MATFDLRTHPLVALTRDGPEEAMESTAPRTWNEDELEAASDMLRISVRGAVTRAKTLEVLAAHAAEERVAAGDVVVTQGERGDRMYLVLEGRLRALRREGDEELVLGEILPSEFFGEIAVMQDAPRMATVRALEPSRVLSVSAEGVRDLLLSDGALSEHVDAVAEGRLA